MTDAGKEISIMAGKNGARPEGSREWHRDAVCLVTETIEALTVSDAERLSALAEFASALTSSDSKGFWPIQEREKEELAMRLRVLDRLLLHTRRNLHLLGREMLSESSPDAKYRRRAG